MSQRLDLSALGRGGTPDKVEIIGPGGVAYQGYVRQVSLDSSPDYGYRGSAGDRIMGSYGPDSMTIEVTLDGRELASFVNRPSKTKTKTKTKTKNEESITMDKYTATIIRDRAAKSANVYLKVNDTEKEPKTEKYLTGSGDIVERIEGTEMPLYGTIPDERFIAMIKAARDEYGL